jgi:hypothetical protein
MRRRGFYTRTTFAIRAPYTFSENGFDSGEKERMNLTKEQLEGLAKRPSCPRCDLDKTVGNALCRRCRAKLPPHMRMAIENVTDKDAWTVGKALRAAANYFNVHFQSVRNFGGGKKR